MRSSLRTLVVLAALVVLVGGYEPLGGQQSSSRPVNAFGAAVGPWAGRVDAMLRDGTLAIWRVEPDTMLPGRTYERLAQRHGGLPVFGGQLIRQRQGETVISVTGRMFENIVVPATPSIAAGDAVSLAETDAGAGAAAGPAELGILPVGDGFVLVYRLIVRGRTDVRRYDVDATTGQIVQWRSELRSQIIGRGTGVLGDPKKLSVRQVAGAFQLVDLLRPGGAWTFALDGSLDRLDAFFLGGALFDADLARDSNNQWTDRHAVDAHAYSGWTQDYFFKRFGRRGLDGADFEMYVIVHPLSRSLASSVPAETSGLFITNALYLHPGYTIFGEGDGVTLDPLAGAFDVVAHEWTHGVTGFTSNLEYVDEPGALNEAFSDIMATGAEFFHFTPGAGPQKGPNFLLGEDVTLVGPGHIRSMQNPISNGNPDHYSQRQFIGSDVDNGGIHINATIVTHAFYLAVAGGTNRVSGITVQGVGTANIADMERIFYRAFVFTLGPLSQFADARAATLQAAAELFGPGSNQRAQLEAAWNAVGVP